MKYMGPRRPRPLKALAASKVCQGCFQTGTIIQPSAQKWCLCAEVREYKAERDLRRAESECAQI